MPELSGFAGGKQPLRSLVQMRPQVRRLLLQYPVVEHGTQCMSLIKSICKCYLLTLPKLMLSGRGATEATTARLMATLARQLGVPNSVIRVEPHARDTHEEAEELRPVLGTAPFVLVTSAVHMPRAMGMFRHMGMDPIPAPTAAGTPNGFALGQAFLALHEYVGLLWAKVQGQI